MESATQQSSATSRAAGFERRKRLGQYFTGVGLGRLLAALAQAEKANSIIDPMAGSGDLLASCLEVGATPNTLAGIEIDPSICKACADRLPQAECILGSAFDPNALSRLTKAEWDLVIANPPYVRYQSFSNKADDEHSLPNAIQVRTGLLQALQGMRALDAEDKRLFANLVSGYSGLSDLAVPSWILCAGLVKQGGRLALVVPESWLTRDYATIVHYLLFRWFDIEFVVEDENASWFEDAQVKTTLIIAKRVERRESALARTEGEAYCHISISAAAANAQSPIGRLASTGTNRERSFATQARLWLRDGSSQSTELARARPVSMTLACKNVLAAAARQKWFGAMGEAENQPTEVVCVPYEIHDWLGRHGLAPAFGTLESQGISVGQGLRTGANGFFYADGVRQADVVALSFAGPLAGLSATVPLGLARPVLRRQSELPTGFVVSPQFIPGWVLDLRRHALPEDMDVADLISSARQRMPDSLAHVVRLAAGANFGTEAKPQKVWELTAVAPNIRPAARGMPARHWYMLPDFAARHFPDVLLARVNSTTPKAYLNKDRECIVDANFSTMRAQPSSRWSPTALLAFMNSAWAQAVVETSGAVMGGGALKVEATHLRRLPVPTFNEAHLCKLSELGSELTTPGGDSVKWLAAIDEVVVGALGSGIGGTAELRRITTAGQERRSKHNAKRGAKDGSEVC